MTFVNEGFWDRVIRMFLAFALGYAAWVAWPGVAAMAFLILGAIALATAAAGWCPLYTLFGCSTARKTTS